MRRGRDGCGGEDHAADRQQRDQPQVVSELAPTHGDAGRIDQRRQHQQQHQFRRQLKGRHARHKGQRDAAQQQQDGGCDVDAPRQQRDARQHGEQNQKNLKPGFHRFKFARKRGRVNTLSEQAWPRQKASMLFQIAAGEF
jgi:hypothetical protein